MRKVIATITMAALMVLGWATGSSAADTRYFQYSSADTKNAEGPISAAYDISEFQMGIANDSELQFYILTKGGVTESDAMPPAFFEVRLDVDLDRQVDYVLNSDGLSLNSVDTSAAHALDAFGDTLTDCEPYAWVTSDGDAVGFSAYPSCFSSLGSYINVQVAVKSANGVWDQQPEGTTFLKWKTSWLAGQVCNASKSKTKKTYDGKTYICVLKSGKWSYQSYASYALALSKYLTERAYYACRLEGVYGAELQDGGKTLSIDSAYLYGLDDSQFTCVEKYLAMPASVKNHIGMTRALDGIQKDSWTHMSAFWNYHPDSGLDITFTYH